MLFLGGCQLANWIQFIMQYIKSWTVILVLTLLEIYTYKRVLIIILVKCIFLWIYFILFSYYKFKGTVTLENYDFPWYFVMDVRTQCVSLSSTLEKFVITSYIAESNANLQWSCDQRPIYFTIASITLYLFYLCEFLQR